MDFSTPVVLVIPYFSLNVLKTGEAFALSLAVPSVSIVQVFCTLHVVVPGQSFKAEKQIENRLFYCKKNINCLNFKTTKN